MNRTATSQPQSLTSGVRTFLRDLITLSELQWQLFQVDLRDGKSRVLRAGVLLAIAPVLALAALPVLFFGGAAAIAEGFGWRLAYVQMGLAAGVMAAAGLIGWWGLHKLSSSLSTLTRSKNELSENIAWLKLTLSEDRAKNSAEFDIHPQRFN